MLTIAGSVAPPAVYLGMWVCYKEMKQFNNFHMVLCKYVVQINTFSCNNIIF